MTTQPQEVEFKTLDGLMLRGVLYPAQKNSPAVIMTPGFNCVKEMLLPEIAANFQEAGVTALIYDPRSVGQSDGNPRSEIDPLKQLEDYSDAISYLSKLESVDSNRIGLWGMSFAGTIAACAAGLDQRAKFVIMICPLTTFTSASHKKLLGVLLKCTRDRESQLRGNVPVSLPVLTAKGENPADLGIAAPAELYGFVTNAEDRGAANFVNRTTLQTYYKLATWHPRGILELVQPPHVMMIVPENDEVAPVDKQISLFEGFSCPKRMHIAAGKRHFDVLTGEDASVLQKMQIDFIRQALIGGIAEEEAMEGMGNF